MNRTSRHFERDQEKQNKLLGLTAIKQTWDEWLAREPIDFTYVNELGQRINDLRARLAA